MRKRVKYFFLFIILFAMGNTHLRGQNESQRIKIDSLKGSVASAKNDTTVASLYFYIGEMYLNLKTDSARKYLLLADEVCIKNLEKRARLKEKERIFFDQLSGNVQGDLGVICEYEGNTLMALEHYKKSLVILEKTPDKKSVATIYNNMSVNYGSLGNVPVQLEYISKALKIYESIKDSIGIARCYNNLGMAHVDQGDIVKALEYLNSSLQLRERIGDKRGTATSLHNVGDIYLQKKNYLKAIEYYNKSIEITREIGFKKGLAYSLNSIGSTYARIHDKQKTLDYFKQSLAIRKEIGDQKGIAYSYGNIGGAYLSYGDQTIAKAYADSAMQIALKIASPDNIQTIAKLLEEIYEKSGNWKGAYEMQSLYIKMHDSINNKENTKKMVQTQMKYEFDKRTSSDSIRNVEKVKLEELKHNQAIQQQKTYTYGGIIGFVMMVIVAGISFRAYRQKQKTNHIISEQKLIVEEKQKEILDSIHYARRIQQSLLPTEKYIERNLNRLKNK